MINIHDYLDEDQIKYLVTNKDLIRSENFTEFYENTWKGRTSNFTRFFLACDIDPLKYMTEAPDWYASYSHDYDIPLPKNITKIGKGAFSDTWLTSVDLSNIEELSDYAFFSNNVLKEVKIGPKLTKLSNKCFCACPSLKEIELPENVSLIGERAFKDCYALEKITILNPDCAMGFEAFYSVSRNAKILVKSGKVANYFKAKNFMNVKII